MRTGLAHGTPTAGGGGRLPATPGAATQGAAGRQRQGGRGWASPRFLASVYGACLPGAVRGGVQCSALTTVLRLAYPWFWDEKPKAQGGEGACPGSAASVCDCKAQAFSCRPVHPSLGSREPQEAAGPARVAASAGAQEAAF